MSDADRDRAERSLKAGLTTLSELSRQEVVPERLDKDVFARISGFLDSEADQAALRVRRGTEPRDVAPPPPPAARRGGGIYLLGVGLVLGIGIAAVVFVLGPSLLESVREGGAPDLLPESVGGDVGLTVLRLDPGAPGHSRREARPGEAVPTGTRTFFRFVMKRAGALYLLQRDPEGRWVCLYPETGQLPGVAPAGERELTRSGRLLGTSLDAPGSWDFAALLAPDSPKPEACRPGLARRLSGTEPGWAAATVRLQVGGGGPGALEEEEPGGSRR